MTATTKLEPKTFGGWLPVALLCLAAWALSTAIALRDPLKLMLEWELFRQHRQSINSPSGS